MKATRPVCSPQFYLPLVLPETCLYSRIKNVLMIWGHKCASHETSVGDSGKYLNIVIVFTVCSPSLTENEIKYQSSIFIEKAYCPDGYLYFNMILFGQGDNF